jgi:hypothetical protein
MDQLEPVNLAPVEAVAIDLMGGQSQCFLTNFDEGEVVLPVQQ